MEFGQLCLVIERRPGHFSFNSIYPVLGCQDVGVDFLTEFMEEDLVKELTRVCEELKEDEVIRFLADGDACLCNSTNDGWGKSKPPAYRLGLSITSIPHDGNGTWCIKVEKRPTA